MINKPAQPGTLDGDREVPQELLGNPNNKSLVIAVVAGVGFVVLLLVGVFLSRQTIQVTDTPIPVPDVAVEPIEQVREQDIVLSTALVPSQSGGYDLQLSLLPVQDSIELTTFAILMEITTDSGEVLTANPNLEVAEQLISDGWSFPFSRTESGSNGLTFKMAGLYINSSPYIMATQTPLISIPLNLSPSTTQINLSLDLQESRFFDKQAMEYVFSLDKNVLELRN